MGKKIQYDEAQNRAIKHFKGPCMVLAAPGSGKTTVITERTAKLITEYGADPKNVLVITFTKAAAMEMKERFLRRIGESRTQVTFGTFHAVFFSILKLAYHFNASNIIREEQKFELVRELVRKHHLDFEDENEFVGDLIGEIGIVKNTGIPLDHYYAVNCGQDVFRELFREYEAKMHGARLIDFDDMLVYTYELFTQREDILSAWQRKYQYILIDEFQDINKIQYDIIKMLAAPENNLFIVGDDDQSIYRFRGAKPEIMLNFPKDFPEAETVLLDTNYRCQKNIVDSSVRLIGYNKERFAKKIRAAREDGAPVCFELFNTQREENKRVLGEIKKRMELPDYTYSDFAVLFRTNTQPRLLMEQMMDYNIPFRSKERIPNLYDHWIAEDLFAYLRMAEGGRMRRDMLRIMNRPKRYITRDSLDEAEVAFDVLEMYYEEQPWVLERLEQFERDLRMLSRLNPYAAVNYIRHGIGYDDFIKEYADYRRIHAEDLYDVLDELQEAAKGYKTFEEWEEHIEEYRAELQRKDKEKQQEKNAVTLATLHGAKGLEYKTVFLVDVNEGIMPYKKAVLDQDLEEERRMFYVGMTRAKDELFLFSVKELNNHEVDISPYIRESGQEKAAQHNDRSRS